MRNIFPRRSFVLPADLRSSLVSKPGLSSSGANELVLGDPFGTFSSSNGDVLSPVDKNSSWSLPKAMEPPVWQHVSLSVFTSNILFSLFRSKTLFLKVKRDK